MTDFFGWTRFGKSRLSLELKPYQYSISSTGLLKLSSHYILLVLCWANTTLKDLYMFISAKSPTTMFGQLWMVTLETLRYLKRRLVERTPTEKHRILVKNSTDLFNPTLSWAIKLSDKLPKLGIQIVTYTRQLIVLMSPENRVLEKSLMLILNDADLPLRFEHLRPPSELASGISCS